MMQVLARLQSGTHNREALGSSYAFAADLYDITETKTPYDDDSTARHR